MCGDYEMQKKVQVHVLATRKVFRTYDAAEEYCKSICSSRRPVIVKTAAVHRLIEGWRRAEEDSLATRSQLNAKEIDMLRRIGRLTYGLNDRMPLWMNNRAIIQKLERHGLIRIKSYGAAHAFDADSTVAELTEHGRDVLKKRK